MFRCLGRQKIAKSLNIVELAVQMHCEGCEKRIRKAISKLEGVDSIDVDGEMQKVTVSGYVDPRKVLKVVRRKGMRAEFWPFPYDSEYHPYDSYYYDDSTFSTTHNYYVHGCNSELQGSFPDFIFTHVLDDDMLWMFNDDNVNACTIM